MILFLQISSEVVITMVVFIKDQTKIILTIEFENYKEFYFLATSS